MDPVGKRLQKDALDAEESGTVTGRVLQFWVRM